MKTAVVASTIWAPSTTTAGTAAAALIISDPLPVNLFVYRGDSGRFRVVVTDPEGLPLDISTASWDCDVRSTPDAVDVVISLDVNEIDVNTIEVVLDPLKSALLVDQSVWDLEMTLNGEVQTLLAGTVHVHKDVSRQ